MFTGQYIHTSAHRSLEYLLHEDENNMFKSLKQAGYHVASLSPRGDLFAPGVTESSMNEVSYAQIGRLQEYGWIEKPPGFEHKNPDKNAKDATLDDRLFYKGLVSEADAQDYDAATIDSALQWLRSNPPEPFCLFLPLMYPHVPFKVEEPYFSMYQDVELPSRVRLCDKTGYEPLFLDAMRREHGLDRATEQDWHRIKAVYVSSPKFKS